MSELVARGYDAISVPALPIGMLTPARYELTRS
jgi:hypothetical protein